MIEPRDLNALHEDLRAEQAALDVVLASLDDAQWHLATPSPGWDVADQIGHLAYFDRAAATAITDPDRFTGELEGFLEAVLAVGMDDYTLTAMRALAPRELLATWREHRAALDAAAATLRPGVRVPWYGPSMSATSFLTARLMEVWAHGCDILETLGVARTPTDRLVHIAQLGFLTRAWSYRVRGEPVPEASIRLELTSPSGALWTWGELDADDVVRGPAEDFCLVVTQRRHLNDTSLATGALGRHWLERAQAFAGGATNGPQPRSTRGTTAD
ncbi:MAG TPA: TIGR03084 family metal-binding protein [Acidimicrobiales bacterium]|nr:TIGR03084 family metal-binding protein [Acidimicrobiales bacterium]